MKYDEWLEMRERIKMLDQQVKGNKKTPFSCKLHGKLEDDFLICRAEFLFSTEQPKTTVLLGLQGGHLMDEGDLDKQAPSLDYDKDDGFTVRVEKEGNPHRLILNFRVPVKKSATGGTERGIDLGLPATAATMLQLDLPVGVKDVRWNGNSEKPVTPGRWQIALEKSKLLNLAWKEPTPPSVGAPLAKVDSQIKVDVDATHVTINVELLLEDAMQKMDEWQIVLPPLAKMEAVKAPPSGLDLWTCSEPDGKGQYTLKTSEATAERWTVAVSLSVPRPNPGPRLPIGPLQVLGAQQTGTITVTMPANVSFGQRLVYTRLATVTQTKNGDIEAEFQFVLPPVADKGPKVAPLPKAPLELAWQFEKNQVQTEVDHTLKLRAVNQGWELDAVTEIKVTALFAAVNAIDIKLPQTRLRGSGMTGTIAPVLAFPGSVPWGSMWKTFGMPWTYAPFEEANVTDDLGNPLKLVPQDATGKTRVLWSRGPVKQMTITLKNTVSIPQGNQRIRLELPRPLGTLERRTKLSIQADERTELLYGPAGAEEPVPDRHRFDLSLDPASSAVDVAWRPHHRDIVTHSTIDLDIHEISAEVRQTLRFPRERPAQGFEAKNPQIALKAPPGITVTSLTGGEIINHDQDRQVLWVRPKEEGAAEIELTLNYDVPVVKKLIALAPIWPAHSSQQDVKVRVWAPAGVGVQLTPDLLQRGVWKQRSIEVVPGHESFPALVVVGRGANLPLAFHIEDAAATSLAAFLTDRALIQVRMAEDGSQQVQARYLVRKIHAPHVDIELPLPRSLIHDGPTFTLGGKKLQWRTIDPTEKVIRVQLHPERTALPGILEITYTIPANALERSYFWSTTLHAPVFRSEVVIGQMRWQLTTQTPMIAAALGRDVRAETQWTLQSGLLTPEPAAASADADAWLTGKEAAPGGGVTFSFAHVSFQPETVYHLPRQGWLLGSSGIFLIVTLGAFFSPLPRRWFWLLCALLSAGLAAFVILFPAAWPGVLFGLQPGVLLFVVFVSVHWLLQERYRRQLVFLPGFSRAKPGSTIVRSAGPKRPREASTVDAPAGSVEAAAAKAAGSQSGT